MRPVRLYAAMVRAYPRGFRERFGPEMVEVFADDLAARGHRAWLTVLPDLAVTVAARRWEDSEMRRGVVVWVAVLAAALAAALSVVGLGGMSVRTVAVSVLAMAAFSGVVYGLASAAAALSRRGAEFDYAGRRMRWWWLIALVIAVAQCAVVVAQLVREPKPENVFAVTVVGGLGALVVGGMRVRTRAAGNWMIAAGVLPMLGFIWWPPAPVAALVVVVAAVSENLRLRRPRAA